MNPPTDAEAVGVRQEDREAAKALSRVQPEYDEGWVEFYAKALARHRIAALEKAAKVCEQQAKDFLDPAYATPQPIGSITERFACKECADAIRTLSREVGP